MVVHFQHKEWPFIGKKPSVQDPGEIGGANTPPNSPTLPRKRGFCRVSAAILGSYGERELSRPPRDLGC